MIIAAAIGGMEFGRFATFRIESGCVKERQEVIVMPGGAPALAKQLVGLEVDVMIFSRVHPEVELALADAGVALISGIDIPPDAAVAAYLNGDLWK
jgi:predicted Fe-Mo cluster-binding NifX family protein